MITSNKITILIKNLHNGGAQKVCVTLCNELVKRNHQVELWLLDYQQNSLANNLHEGVKIYHLKKKKVKDSAFKLLELYRKQKPSRILIFNIELTVLSIFLKKIFRFRTQIFFRSINTLSQISQFPRTRKEKYITSRIIPFILPYCDRIIAQSNGMKHDLITNFKIDERKIVTIHNPAVHLSKIDSGEVVPVNKKEGYFLYVGRLTPQKGLETLINIFEKTSSQLPGIKLVIVGEGSEEEKLKSIVTKRRLSSIIEFAGFKQNTSDYYINAKATVLTSLYEGFPNVLVESIAAGTPVIAFDCPSGPKDIIEPGVNGILVPNQDTMAFTEALLSVATDRVKFRKQDVLETAKKFSVEIVVNQYEEILNAQ